MDRRLGEYLDALNDGKTVFLRNAGANIRSLEPSIKELMTKYNITRIHVAAHTDCGGMNVVASSIGKKDSVSKHIWENLVEQFSEVKFENREELERKNEILQREAARRVVGEGVEVSSELIDVNAINAYTRNNEHTVVITKPSDKRYGEITSMLNIGIYNAYLVQSSNIDNIIADIEIVKNYLNVVNMEFLAFDREEYLQTINDMLNEKDKEFMDDSMMISFIKAKK